jgi:Ca-activated chloride channel family protein
MQCSGNRLWICRTFILLLLGFATLPMGWGQAEVHIAPRRLPNDVFDPAAHPPAPASDATDRLTFRARTRAFVKDVNLVLVPVTVTDAWNRLILGLRPENFMLLEDDNVQTIRHFSSEDSPISLCVVFDVSKSMKNKIDEARQAVEHFIISSNPQDEFCLITFSERPNFLVDFNDPGGTLLEKLANVTPSGHTALLDAIYMGIDSMRLARNARKVLLVVSDGDDNRSRYNAREITDIVKESDVEVFSIGIFDGWYLFTGAGSTAGPRLLRRLAEASGGTSVMLSSTKDLEDAAENLNLLMRNQYLLGYRPENPSRDGKWRKLKVTLNPADRARPLHVTAKSGYYAPGH